MNRSTPTLLTAAIVATALLGLADEARAQHVTEAMAATMRTQAGTSECEENARQATTRLDVLSTNLERARQTNNEAEIRPAIDAVQKGFLELKGRLASCRGGAGSPAAAPPAKPAAGGMDHAAMGHAAPAGAAAAPTTVRQISGPAEAALQSFQDALQIGNRDVASQWLAPDVTVTEWGVTDTSRDGYASQHMALDMTFLKTAKVVLLDRQVRPAGEATQIVSTSRITGRAGEMPLDVRVSERAVLKNTSEGWRVMSLEWSVEPAKEQGRCAGVR